MNQGTNRPPADDPLLRHRATEQDLGPESQDHNALRVQALKQTTAKPVAPGTGRWVQLGPTAIPNGAAVSPDVRVLVTGRVTAVVVHPQDGNTLYVGAAQGGVWKTPDGSSHWVPTS
ncbi:MAG: hypothetical protein JO112_11640, partial [Planctomycetes bacterium]|nr:hypothetical protein [Planctomycetota bacterium]